MHRAMAIAGALAAGTWLFEASVVWLPTFEHSVAVASLVPPVAALVLGESLIEPVPEAVKLAHRSLPTIYGTRYLMLQLTGAVITLAMVTAVDPGLYAVVPAFVALSALCVAALQEWYWVPLLPTVYGWLHLSQSDHYLAQVDVGVLELGAIVLASGAVYSCLAPRWVSV